MVVPHRSGRPGAPGYCVSATTREEGPDLGAESSTLRLNNPSELFPRRASFASFPESLRLIACVFKMTVIRAGFP